MPSVGRVPKGSRPQQSAAVWEIRNLVVIVEDVRTVTASHISEIWSY